MAWESNKLVVVGVLIGGDKCLHQSTDPLALSDYPLTKAVNVVSEFGLTIKSLKVGRVWSRNYRSWQTFAAKP
jgi:hypothetical protein